MKCSQAFLLLSAYLFNISNTIASDLYDPWFTGPLIADTAKVVAPRKRDFWFKTFETLNQGIYNNSWQFQNNSRNKNILYKPSVKYGLFDKVEVKTILPYQTKLNQGVKDSGLGDVGFAFDYQLLRPTLYNKAPYILLSIQETLPTGCYDHLKPALSGTDAFGMGSFQTVVGLDYEHQADFNLFSKAIDINTRINVSYTAFSSVSIDGLSTYGGTVETQGRIKPGNTFIFDLSTELSLTQHWVVVIEEYYEYQEASAFQGTLEQGESTGTTIRGPTRRARHAQGFVSFLPNSSNIEQGTIGNGNVAEFTLAPAIEYNFAEHLGIIGGVWFIVAGKNTPSFHSASLSFHVIG